MGKVCSCGTDHDAVERATNIVAKQIRDGECPHFITAVGLAYNEIMGTIAESLMAEIESNAKKAKLILLLHELHGQIEQRYNSGDYRDILQEAVDAQNAREDEERNLPKGD